MGGGSRRVARLAFVWALMGCGVASAAAAQQAAPKSPAPKAKTSSAASVMVQQSRAEWWRNGAEQPAALQQRPGPYLAPAWKPAQSHEQPVNNFSLSDQHVIVVSTLSLILVGVIVLLLVT